MRCQTGKLLRAHSLDHKPYDSVVLTELLDIADAAVSDNLCETDEQEDIKKDLDELCDEIRERLNAFENKPESSYPYYVSLVAKNHAY